MKVKPHIPKRYPFIRESDVPSVTLFEKNGSIHFSKMLKEHMDLKDGVKIRFMVITENGKDKYAVGVTSIEDNGSLFLKEYDRNPIKVLSRDTTRVILSHYGFSETERKKTCKLYVGLDNPILVRYVSEEKDAYKNRLSETIKIYKLERLGYA